MRKEREKVLKVFMFLRRRRRRSDTEVPISLRLDTRMKTIVVLFIAEILMTARLIMIVGVIIGVRKAEGGVRIAGDDRAGRLVLIEQGDVKVVFLMGLKSV
jgi:hypothetical protein